MIEELKEAPPPPEPSPKKEGLVKMLIMGGAFLALTGIVSVGTVLILGTDEIQTSANSTAANSGADSGSDGHAEEPVAEKKTNAMDDLMQNLAILDYQPGSSEITTKDGTMLIQDSVDAMTWILQEKENLANWKKQLEARQLELNKLDKQVSQKLLKIEQVETARVAQLAKLYDGMQPTAVAQLMANLDDKTVVNVIPKMNIKQASAVLALMPPARAAKLSKQLMTIAEN